MQDGTITERTLRLFLLPILGLVFCVQIYVERGLYLDGANDLLTILLKGDFLWEDWMRIVGHLIEQAPMVLAFKLGLHDLAFLRLYFSTWLLLRPLVVWGAALWTLRDDALFWPFVLFFCFVYFNIDFFPVGEFALCSALVAFCFSMLIRPLKASRLARGGLLAAAMLLPFHYPSTLFHGPLLGLLAWKKPEEEWNGATKLYRYSLMALFALSAATGLCEVLSARDPVNFESARDAHILVYDAQFRYLLAYVVLAALAFFLRKTWMRLVVLGLCGGLLFMLYGDPVRVLPFAHYCIRAYMAVAMAVLGIGLWWMRKKLAKADTVPLFPVALALILLVNLAGYDVEQSIEFGDFVSNFTNVVNNRSGLVPHEAAVYVLDDKQRRFGQIWTYPLMSVIYRANADKAIILNPSWFNGYQPFDPFKEIPDLSKYYQ